MIRKRRVSARSQKPRATKAVKKTKTAKGKPKLSKTPKANARKAPIRLLPVMRPEFNMREIIKQLTLLEDHHNHAEKRCPNCVSKHGKCIEGLAEEAVTLCKPGPEHRQLAREASQVARGIRVLHHAWAEKPKDDALNTLVAAKLRLIRKRLQKKYAFMPLKALPTEEADAVRAILHQTSKN